MKTLTNIKTLVITRRRVSKKLNHFLVIWSIALLSLLFGNSLIANNLQIGVPTLGANTISFTIQWDNSWYLGAAPDNWDAVWIFVKRQDCADNLWVHSPVSLASGDHGVTGGVLQVDAVADGLGVFIRRSAIGGPGNIASATVTIRLQNATNAVDNFKVFGVEMVSIPQGDFSIGDGTRGTNNYGFSDGTNCGAGPWAPKLITNGIQTSGLGVAGGYQCNNWGSTSALPASFPLGWNNYYCMKYELSQEQYFSFLNTLTYDQQSSRVGIVPNSAVGTLAIAGATVNRNSIEIETAGTNNNIPAIFGCDFNNNNVYNEAGDGQNIACNWLSWGDLAAYLDWSALRPMTEFEFEKVCRGPSVPLANEFAWGSPSFTPANGSALTNGGQSSELSTSAGIGLTAIAIANSGAVYGPLRCGFAATSTTNRLQAGASYYGVMDMTGNNAEQCVGGYAFNYSSFTNANGNGDLTVWGDANMLGWPGLGGGQNGALMRGGNWFHGAQYGNISDRYWMIRNENQGRYFIAGGRGVRTY